VTYTTILGKSLTVPLYTADKQQAAEYHRRRN